MNIRENSFSDEDSYLYATCEDCSAKTLPSIDPDIEGDEIEVDSSKGTTAISCAICGGKAFLKDGRYYVHKAKALSVLSEKYLDLIEYSELFKYDAPQLVKNSNSNINTPEEILRRKARTDNPAYSTFLNAEGYYAQSAATNALIAEDNYSLLKNSFAISAFAIELYLKCILQVEGLDGRGHLLSDLYKKIKPDTKIKLIALHERFLVYNPNDLSRYPQLKEALKATPTDPGQKLEYYLKEASNTFAEARYYHEKKPGTTTGWRLGSFKYALRKYLLDLHPEWITQAF